MLIEVLSLTSTWTLFAIIAGLYSLSKQKRTNFPIINDYPGDLFRQKAYREYSGNARKLITEGFNKHRGPIGLFVPGGIKFVLPSTFSDWVKSNRDLGHQELIREEYFAGWSGFEASYAIHEPNRTLIEVIRTKLSQNEKILPTINQHVAIAFQQHWGNDETWHQIDWEKDMTGIISRAAESVFVGPEKAGDPEWQDLVQTYVHEYFSAVGELRAWRAPLRPIVQWFLPHTSACRSLVPRARAIIDDVVRKREQEAKAARDQGLESRQYEDVIAWTQNDPKNNLPAGDIQLGLATAALFTTTEAFRQVVIDIAEHPELVAPLREEIKLALSGSKLGLDTLSKMELLDSVMKESQRRVPLMVGLERKVIRDTTIPDGTILPKGSHVMVDSRSLWSPEDYDGYRFLKRRQVGDKTSLFVQSSNDHNVFGGGRYICPGRFFASSELKICLAHVLLKYDFRLKDGYFPKPLQFGVYAMVDPAVQLEVRRRKEFEDPLLLVV